MTELTNQWVRVYHYHPERDTPEARGDDDVRVTETVEDISDVRITYGDETPDGDGIAVVGATESSEHDDGEPYQVEITLSEDVVEAMYETLQPSATTVSDVESRIPDGTDERIVEFCTLVEEEVGNRVSLVDPMMEGTLCWFALDIPLEFEGEEFEAELEVDLSEDDVRPVIAEIECAPDDNRREILEANASRLDGHLFEYQPSENELDPLLTQLEDIHSRVFS